MTITIVVDYEGISYKSEKFNDFELEDVKAIVKEALESFELFQMVLSNGALLSMTNEATKRSAIETTSAFMSISFPKFSSPSLNHRTCSEALQP